VYLGEVQMRGSEVSTCVVKWSEILNKRVSNTIRRYTDRMKFAAYVAFSFFLKILRVLLFCLKVPRF
jgi:hypothetical protein